MVFRKGKLLVFFFKLLSKSPQFSSLSLWTTAIDPPFSIWHFFVPFPVFKLCMLPVKQFWFFFFFSL